MFYGYSKFLSSEMIMSKMTWAQIIGWDSDTTKIEDLIVRNLSCIIYRAQGQAEMRRKGTEGELMLFLQGANWMRLHLPRFAEVKAQLLQALTH